MTKFTGLGPVFAFDLLTTSRHWHIYAARSLFVLGLLAGLAIIWWANVAGENLDSIRAQALVGRQFAQALAATQIGLAILVAPAATAGAFCLERSRGTLTHVVLTDLTSLEIVLGKLVSRLLPVVGMVLCSAPFLSLGMLLGGIDPWFVLGLILVTLGASILGCTLALTLSIWGNRLTEVVLTTYVVWLAATLLPPVWFMLNRAGGIALPVPYWLEHTSPVLMLFLQSRNASVDGLADSVRSLGICLGFSIILTAFATFRIRAAATLEPVSPLRGTGFFHLIRPPGPSLDSNPILWREWHAHRQTRRGFILWGIYATMAIASTASIASLTATSARGRWVGAGFLNGLQVSAGMLLFSISAASVLAEERVRGNLDVILATPLSTRSIVMGKWWGTYRTVLVLALPPGLATVSIAWNHDHWIGVLLIVGRVLSYGALFTSLGLALATWVPKMGRAVGLSVAAHVGITVGWTVFCLALTARSSGITGPGLASFSPMLGIMLPTLEMQFSNPAQWHQVVGWTTFWILADATLAAGLLIAVLSSFNACLGRVAEHA